MPALRVGERAIEHVLASAPNQASSASIREHFAGIGLDPQRRQDVASASRASLVVAPSAASVQPVRNGRGECSTVTPRSSHGVARMCRYGLSQSTRLVDGSRGRG